MENWLAYAVALYVAGRFPASSRSADALLVNWVLGHLIFLAAGGVSMPALIVLDFATGAFLLRFVATKTARAVAVFSGLSIMLNGALYIGGTVPNVWINALAWAQVAALYWGAFGDGLGALVDRLSGGGGNRRAAISRLSQMEGEAP